MNILQSSRKIFLTKIWNAPQRWTFMKTNKAVEVPISRPTQKHHWTAMKTMSFLCSSLQTLLLYCSLNCGASLNVPINCMNDDDFPHNPIISSAQLSSVFWHTRRFLVPTPNGSVFDDAKNSDLEVEDDEKLDN